MLEATLSNSDSIHRIDNTTIGSSSSSSSKRILTRTKSWPGPNTVPMLVSEQIGISRQLLSQCTASSSSSQNQDSVSRSVTSKQKQSSSTILSRRVRDKGIVSQHTARNKMTLFKDDPSTSSSSINSINSDIIFCNTDILSNALTDINDDTTDTCTFITDNENSNNSNTTSTSTNTVTSANTAMSVNDLCNKRKLSIDIHDESHTNNSSSNGNSRKVKKAKHVGGVSVETQTCDINSTTNKDDSHAIAMLEERLHLMENYIRDMQYEISILKYKQ